MRNLLASLTVALGLAVPGVPARGADLTIFAAASLKEALDEQVARFETESGGKIVVSYAASNALAKQIESGAPADVFVSADVDWVDYLEQRKLVRGGTRINLLRNRLVLIAPADSRTALRIAPGFELAAALGTGRLSIANPDSVPAGKYARDALRALGAWPGIESRVARVENVRAALVLVARGEAPFGIVYATDALAEPKVRIVDTFPENTHAPIVYPVAILATSRSPYAQRFVDSLVSPVARTIWVRHGFAMAN
ncbi:MAG TPA: molybdate ABC transporter substrate-binding protein [Casimicrobiaceae bacterium]|jgi:molybdate transport system substrate-binding protein|nr:molybdate ABC transporter substrate-binding protein [Casimicrobiaceae bacterium]